VPEVWLDETAEGNVYAALRTREADLPQHLHGAAENDADAAARQEARDDDACHPNGGMTVEVAEQNHHVIAERGQLGEREFEALGEQGQEICSGPLPARYRLRCSRHCPHSHNSSTSHGHAVS